MKMTRVTWSALILFVFMSVFVLVGCGGTTSTTSSPSTVATQTSPAGKVTPLSTEQPVAPISSSQASSSDIPDTQTFVTFISATGHYLLNTPEGWARTTNNTDISYVFSLDIMQVKIMKSASVVTADSVRANQAVTLQQTGRAIRDVKVSAVQLPSGPAVLISYTSNSDPNAVTGKQVRLENNSYLYYKNGMLATLTLSAPVGADNVDQWARISRSFKWV
ncbi:MAG TPA: hypothetical protein VIY29_16555 [Ktedonobacteraceae bacterium]